MGLVCIECTAQNYVYFDSFVLGLITARIIVSINSCHTICLNFNRCFSDELGTARIIKILYNPS